MSNLLGARNQTKLLLACCAVGAPLFVATALIEGAGRAGYEPIREPVSALALGERGWIQRANFVGTGLAMLAGASGLRRSSSARAGSSWGPRLVGAYAVGLIGAGLFTMDPIVIGSATRSDDADPGARPPRRLLPGRVWSPHRRLLRLRSRLRRAWQERLGNLFSGDRDARGEWRRPLRSRIRGVSSAGSSRRSDPAAHDHHWLGMGRSTRRIGVCRRLIEPTQRDAFIVS